MSAEACLKKLILKDTPLDYLEIGVLRAKNLVELAKEYPLLQITGVDSYEAYEDTAHGYFVTEQLSEYNKNIAKKAIQPYSNIKLYCETSQYFSKQIPDKSFDIIFLDKSFSVDTTYLDILDFYPKVKSGGILCGHDAWTHEVILGVNKAFLELGLPEPKIIDKEVWYIKI